MTDIKAALQAEIEKMESACDEIPFGLDEEDEQCLWVMREALKEITQRDTQIVALTAENVTLKASRETLANNSLEACNEIYCAGYRNTALYDGLKKSTGDRNTYPNPIRLMVDEATKQLQTPATDAAANALRAEGVNHAGKTVMAMLNHQDKGVGRALEVMPQVEMNYIKPVGGSVADGN